MKKEICLFAVAACLLTGCKSVDTLIPTKTEAPLVTEAFIQVTEAPAQNETQVPAASGKVVRPLPAALDVGNLRDCMVHAAFSDAIRQNGDRYEITLEVYEQELFDLVDMSLLEAGDTIVISGREVMIQTLEMGGSDKVINGGFEMGGYTLRTNEDGVYYTISYSDALDYYSLGKATLPLAKDFTLTDASDLEKGEEVFSLEDSLNLDKAFTPASTVVHIENGEVTEINCYYAG